MGMSRQIFFGEELFEVLQDGRSMRSRLLWCLLGLALSIPQVSAQATKSQTPAATGGDFSNNIQPGKKVPAGVILVKGAWASASDSVTPLPEGAEIQDNLLRDPYFRISYPLPADWEERYKGPPPSEGGRFVLAQLSPANTFKGADRGT